MARQLRGNGHGDCTAVVWAVHAHSLRYYLYTIVILGDVSFLATHDNRSALQLASWG